jgi:hypothetical protein
MTHAWKVLVGQTKRIVSVGHNNFHGLGGAEWFCTEPVAQVIIGDVIMDLAHYKE